MDAHTVLVKARNLIADEKDWVPYAASSPSGPNCALGALNEVTDRDAAKWSGASDVLGAIVGEPMVYPWNDRSTHAEVLAAFDEAIAATAPEPDVSFVTEPAREAVA